MSGYVCCFGLEHSLQVVLGAVIQMNLRLVTILYRVLNTLLDVPVRKNGVEVWLNGARVAFSGTKSIVTEPLA